MCRHPCRYRQGFGSGTGIAIIFIVAEARFYIGAGGEASNTAEIGTCARLGRHSMPILEPYARKFLYSVTPKRQRIRGFGLKIALLGCFN